MALDPIDDALHENALGPQEASSDGVSVKQHDLADQIEADRYLASKNAAVSGLGVRRVLAKPPGATGRSAT